MLMRGKGEKLTITSTSLSAEAYISKVTLPMRAGAGLEADKRAGAHQLVTSCTQFRCPCTSDRRCLGIRRQWRCLRNANTSADVMGAASRLAACGSACGAGRCAAVGAATPSGVSRDASPRGDCNPAAVPQHTKWAIVVFGPRRRTTGVGRAGGVAGAQRRRRHNSSHGVRPDWATLSPSDYEIRLGGHARSAHGSRYHRAGLSLRPPPLRETAKHAPAAAASRNTPRMLRRRRCRYLHPSVFQENLRAPLPAASQPI